MKIAYVTVYDSKDIKYWSGTGYYIAQSLEASGCVVHRIGPLRERFSLIVALKQRLYSRICNRIYIRDRTPFVLDGFVEQVSQKLSEIKADIIFAPSPIPVAHLDSNKPLVIWTDAVFAAMIDFNPSYKQVCGESIRDAISLEKKAYKKAALAIFASDWAAESAISLYHLDKRKVKVAPFGPNIECNRKINDIYNILSRKQFSTCKLLFVGVDWALKGGDFAVKVAESLNSRGIPTELNVVGCNPSGDLPDFVNVHGFLSKKSREEKERLARLYQESHFFILPSLAECYGIVFAEASSFGLPSLATNIGGIPTAVKEGKNGKLFSIESSPEETSYIVSELFCNQKAYRELSISSFREYENRLNWKASGEKIKNTILDLLDIS